MDSGGVVRPGSSGLISHIMESLFFSMSVYEPTQDAVLHDLQRRFGKVQPLIDYGFEGDGKQAIFAARSQSGRVIVACRGTAGFRDVLQDLKYLQSRLSFVKGAAAHWGFAERAESVPIDVFCKLLEAGEELIFTGHSLGGAVASLLSLRVLESGKGMFDDQVRCITFGCPLFASCRLAELINCNYKDVFIHIVSKRDVVPKIFPFLSTLQKLTYADEDHLEGLFVLKSVLAFLPGLPLAALITGVERKIPSLLKLLFRCFMKLAFPSGMTGSYAFAGHIVMLDSEATVDRSLILASADEMNAWHSQLGFAFGGGFDVAMIEEHMLDCYHNGIVRAFSQVRLHRDLSFANPSWRPSSSLAMFDKISHCNESSIGRRGLGGDNLSYMIEQSSVVIRLIPQDSKNGVDSMDCEIQVRCDSGNAAPFASAGQVSPKAGGVCSPALTRTKSAIEQNAVRSVSWRLERSMTMTSNSTVWTSRHERRDGALVKPKDRSIMCRLCSHLQVHMNIKTCCHQGSKRGLGIGWFLGTIGRVARHLRILDNLCYLTFIRIVLTNLVG